MSEVQFTHPAMDPHGVVSASRYHDISTGHRVCRHESKCAHLHGHNYRIHFHVIADPSAKKVDKIGRVMDFSVIKSKLCMWLEDNWDHKFLIWEEDPWAVTLKEMDPEGVVFVPFNPTAENMAAYLVRTVGPMQLLDTDCMLVMCRIEETMKCSATFIGDPTDGLIGG